ncbi:MAG TPA: NAD(P)/FAD-dependent oxidoreductase [Acidimicrobiia bacterium]|nr:NAD(P)/FAD-dependent oxidoreductase [Acidimicrobiia bacterium]
MSSPVTGRAWDAVIVGAGHNGLTAAAYLARAGQSVLVLERRGQLGGACTLETPFADERFVMSPCAYLVGLLHPLVVEELELRRRGYRVQPVDPHLWCPFDDGTALTLWDDPAMTRASLGGIAPGDVEGYLAYEALFGRIRRALRGDYTEATDTWLGPAPGRAEIEERLGHDPELIEILFDTPIADVIERHVGDERLRTALHGQGIIGTFAGPREPGTAAVHAMHSLGTIDGLPGAWGYVEGGMGRISLALAEAATEAGAVILTDAPVAAILPGEGNRPGGPGTTDSPGGAGPTGVPHRGMGAVRNAGSGSGAGPAVVLEAGDVIRAKAVVSNADPKRTLALCQAAGGDLPEGFAAFAARVDGWRSESPVVKINCGLSRLPTFTAAARPGYDGPPPYRAMVTISTGTDDTQAACEAARRGEPAPAWCELYFQTAYDGRVAPPGAHTMSVFAQYVPYGLAHGDWDGRREEIADLVVAGIARFAPDVADCIVERQVLGPPDVEERIGLTGGHIFQGECLPDQMWDRRFGPATPIPGLWLCGAATHPGGSVIAANGRNAARAVLRASR